MTDTVTQDSAETAAQTIVQLDPRTLLVDLNIREARIDADLVDSIKELGVLQAVTVVTTPEGAYRVRYGHRRTLAAIEAGRPLIPAVVAGAEGSAKAAQVARIVEQWHENEVRANLTRAERIEATAQLAAFGVSPTQIAKRTRQAKDEVRHAITVAASPAARQAAQEHEALTLKDAALLAEFEGDDDAVARILAVAGRTWGSSPAHVAQKIRDERADEARRAEFVEGLRAAGVTVLDPKAEDYTGRALSVLLDTEGQRITVEGHEQCPGHAAVIGQSWGWLDPATGLPATAQVDDQDDQDEEDQDEDQDERDDEDDKDEANQTQKEWGSYPTTAWVCADPAAHGHAVEASSGSGTKRAADMGEAEREAAKEARRTVIRCNKEWKAAQPVRREWLTTFLTRKTAPKDAAAFMAQIVATEPGVLARIEANELAAVLLGLAENTGYGRSKVLTEAVAKASDTRAQVLLLAQVLAGCEASLHQNSWRNLAPTTSRYLLRIEEWGYRLADVERLACGIETLPEVSTEQ
ncbi:ParB/RepB/Spo0J family partition protein [Kineococcus sp. SYSU DK003]|uniref:ParB/RepB/Spo0J family partition protein n=1 Tax=Kineococcus sp. SYSU DK003 TaxID=3383124 RepID=UPI003D7CE998